MTNQYKHVNDRHVISRGSLSKNKCERMKATKIPFKQGKRHKFLLNCPFYTLKIDVAK